MAVEYNEKEQNGSLKTDLHLFLGASITFLAVRENSISTNKTPEAKHLFDQVKNTLLSGAHL